MKYIKYVIGDSRKQYSIYKTFDDTTKAPEIISAFEYLKADYYIDNWDCEKEDLDANSCFSQLTTDEYFLRYDYE